MVDTEKALDLLKELGVTINEVFRYAYGGLLAYLVAERLAPNEIEDMVERLGTPLSVLTAFGLGCVIYIGYRPVIGEALYWLQDWLHRLSNCMGKTNGYTCHRAYLMTRFGLSRCMATEAFRILRDGGLLNQERQRRFHLQHSEMHMLYVTFFVLSVGVLAIWCLDLPNKRISWEILLMIALFALVSALRGDMLLCRQECRALLLHTDPEIRKLLVDACFIEAHNKAGEAAQQGAPADADGPCR